MRSVCCNKTMMGGVFLHYVLEQYIPADIGFMTRHLQDFTLLLTYFICDFSIWYFIFR